METDNDLTVGARVEVHTRSDENSDTNAVHTGAIVEDFGVQPPESTSREWAVAKRWAVALDSGRLVFADTDDLTVL